MRLKLMVLLICCLSLGVLGMPGLAQREAYASPAMNLYFSMERDSYSLYQKSLADASEAQVIAQKSISGAPTGIAVDADNEFLYYAADRSRIYKLKQDTLQVVDTYESGNLIVELALDAAGNRLYMIDNSAGSGPGTFFASIKVLDLASRSITTIHATPEDGLAFIYGLAVDSEGGKIYFYKGDFNSGISGIFRMDLDGGNVEGFMPGRGHSGLGFVIDRTADKLYFSENNSIRAASLSTGEVQPLPVYSGSDWIGSIARDPSTGTFYFGTNDSSIMKGRIYRVLSADQAEQVVPNEGYLNALAIAPAPLTYTIEPIDDQTLTVLAAGYASGTQETKSVTITRTGTGVLENVTASLSGTDADAFELTQPAGTIDGESAAFTVKAKDGLAVGTYTTTVTINADKMEPVSFTVTQVVHSYAIAPIANQTLTELAAGYAAGTQETKSVTITRTGTGVLENVAASLGGTDAEAFELTQPAGTIDGESAAFTVKAKDGLPAGTYTAAVSITADYMEPVSFHVTQVVHAYTIAPIADSTLSELVVGYAPGTQEARTLTITRTGTGILTDVSVSLSGANADAFVLTQPEATIDDMPSTFTVKAKDGLDVGTYTATIQVNAQYMIPVNIPVTQVIRPSAEDRLSGLHISEGTLSPAFDPDVTAYSASVPYATESITVAAATYDVNAGFTIFSGGDPITGSAPLEVGSNVLEVRVTAQDGVSVKTYTINVMRAPSSDASIRSLSLQGIALNETVHADVYAYTATVTNAVYETYLHAEPAHADASISALTVNGVPAGNPIPLSVGSNIIEVEVEAQDGVTKRTYTITVTREASGNAQLSSLDISGGTLSPAFAPSVYAYTAAVSFDTEAVSVTASVYHSNAILSINGQLQASGSPASVPLEVGPNIIRVAVLAEDGIHSANYTLSIQRAASSNAGLAGLVLSDGALTPAFEADRAAYTAAVPHSVSHVTVTASVNDPGAAVKVNGQEATSGEPSAPIALAVGENTITVEVTAQDGSTAQTYSVVVTRAQKPTEPGPGRGGSSPSSGGDAEADNEARLGLYINDTYLEQLATNTTTNTDGIIQTVLTVDTDLMKAELERVEDDAVVRIQVDHDADEVIAVLTGDIVKAMEDKRMTLLVQTPIAGYWLPAAEISIDLQSEQLGHAAHADMVVQLVIAKSSKSKADMLESAAREGGFTVQASPVDFTLHILHDGESLEVSRFSEFVQREMPVSAAAGAGSVTTAVVVEEDGRLRHVPTSSTTRDGEAYAVIRSLTNSTYAVIANTARFGDVEGHWSQAAVNNLASRLIVSGVEQDRFDPNAVITRAEFAALIARALGLPANEKKALFQDVSLNAWYAGAVTTANAYGIIQGYEDGTFRPAKTITREEAMVVLAKASRLAGLDAIDAETADDPLSEFIDGLQVQAWARESAAAAIHAGLISGANGELRPADSITRAETASIVYRLLVQAGLIEE
ncbi:cadherin-like beta sandwich domain-containing protein [Xylanibacillus composti]|uniref:SLH domain-containing protein n=1 Tax=Xylanibacillus composti TaxID=1572762 RepID=A0A8J4M4M6_9BACL|nr:cadherin-like beta sandwich domain-containing protein [Xylanibacillus composti]GIQ71360.1 hypothetical protein XYCOK13_41840 [Xylanibacillus composti]